MRTVSPRPSRFARSHSRPRAAEFTHSVTLSNLFNAGLTLHDAETSGRLHIGGDLIVKLPRHRVLELIDDGDAQPFAPAGRTFKEWASVPHREEPTWRALLAEARAHAVGR